MPKKPIHSTCPHCENKFSSIPRRSFLGFQKLRCPTCQKFTVTHPLTLGYRIFYWVFITGMFTSIRNSFAEGKIGIPGGLGILISIAVVKDLLLCHRLKGEFGEKDYD